MAGYRLKLSNSPLIIKCGPIACCGAVKNFDTHNDNNFRGKWRIITHSRIRKEEFWLLREDVYYLSSRIVLMLRSDVFEVFTRNPDL